MLIGATFLGSWLFSISKVQIESCSLVSLSPPLLPASFTFKNLYEVARAVLIKCKVTNMVAYATAICCVIIWRLEARD